MRVPDGIPLEWVETSPTNHYGERVVAHVVSSLRYDETPRYRCKDAYWGVAFKAWVKSRRDGAEIPEPFPEGHCMFLDPVAYSCVPWGVDVPQRTTRRAIRNGVVNDLSGGWDREMRKSLDGMRQLAQIVRATVNAKLLGEDVGIGHYFACIAANL